MNPLTATDYHALAEEIAEEIAKEMAKEMANQAAKEAAAYITAAARPAQAAAWQGAIEHTRLAADTSPAQVEQLCAEAVRHGFAGVCVHPAWIGLAAAALRGSPVLAVTVIGFPLGATLSTVKCQEAAECLKLGADELDMVINLGALKAQQDQRVRGEIAAVCHLAHQAGARVKVILEMASLDQEQKLRACRLAVEAGADFLKTSTGFGPGGATVADVALLHTALRSLPGTRVGIKAAGGIRTLAEATALLRAGATRIGTSSALQFLAP